MPARDDFSLPPTLWLRISALGGLAAMLRFALTDGGGWAPLLLANLAGCALLGVLVARGRATPAWSLGFCGSLTTFSGVMTLAGGAGRGEQLAAFGEKGAALPGGAGGLAAVIALNAAGGAAAFALARHAARPGGGTG